MIQGEKVLMKRSVLCERDSIQPLRLLIKGMPFGPLVLCHGLREMLL